MCKIKSILLIIIFTISCSDRSEIISPTEVETGNVNFSRFVTIGNSLTAGMQNSALYEKSQGYSFGEMIANQVGIEFEQPIISDPGIGGRIEIESLDPLSIKSQPLKAGSPINSDYAGIYNNLGIPGALLKDILFASNSQTATQNFNIFFDIILRDQGTVLDLAMLSEPTILTLWIGNNDILSYATSGGISEYTKEDEFAIQFDQLCGALSSGNFPVIMANIPRIKFIPFFTTIGNNVASILKELQLGDEEIKGLYYESAGSNNINLATIENLTQRDILITLSSTDIIDFIGDTTGTYYNSSNMQIPENIDISFPFGLAQENPFPNRYVLDENEILTLDRVTANYNATIGSISIKYNFELIDMHDFFNEIANEGIIIDGLKFSSEYIFGGFFSLDGIHPTSQGYGIIANLFIEKINAVYDAKIPLVNVSTIPGSIEIVNKTIFNKYGLPNFAKDTFNSIFY